MQAKPFYYLIILTLSLLGGWGVWQINGSNEELDQLRPTAPIPTAGSADIARVTSEQLTLNPETSDDIDDDNLINVEVVLSLIKSGEYLSAVHAINDNHSYLSQAELDLLKSELISFALQTQSNAHAKRVLSAISQAYDDINVWKYLANAAASDSDWEMAFNAYFRASKLENDSTNLQNLLTKLVISSGHLRRNFESTNDLISVKNMYQSLADTHPNFQRFHYELALSSVKIGETEHAKQLLQNLIYDPELGEVSKQALAVIASNDIQPEESAADQANPDADENRQRNNDVVVPLISVGSSFIVNTNIDRKPVPLLLDTGASITSLSSSIIERLGLQPTGQTIRLSTANGVTSSRVYRVKQLRLGSLVLRNMQIAEIDLNNNRNFQGLLGTDALNQLKPQYSYLIDNQKRALIFRER